MKVFGISLKKPTTLNIGWKKYLTMTLSVLILAIVLALPLGTNSFPGGHKVKDSPLCEDVNNKMKNIGYILSGYDLWFGNPLAVEQTVDPGFRGQIFAAHYGDTLTADNRYCVPGKTLISMGFV